MNDLSDNWSIDDDHSLDVDVDVTDVQVASPFSGNDLDF